MTTKKCKTPIPYTRVRNSITSKMDAMALDFCIEMEKFGVICIPIPTLESEWDKNTERWRGIISCHRCRDVCPYNLGSRN